MTVSLRIVLLLAAAMFLAPLAACEESKITAENFELIKTGMTTYEVEQILGGSGTDDTTSGGFGISGGGVLDSKQTNEKRFIWADGESKIVVIFREGKVVEKSKIGL